MKYRKKPVVIEAVQWFKDGDHPAVVPMESGNRHHQMLPDYGLKAGRVIATLEGPHQVRAGDWIVTGIKGEHYPVKPDIFALTYEPVGEGA